MKTIIAILALAATAQAGHCQFHVQKFHHGYHAQQVLAVHVPYYAVGLHLQAESLVEKAAERAALKIVEQIQSQQQFPAESLQAPADSPLFDVQDHFGKLIKSSCVKCHNAQKASGGINLDLPSIDGVTFYRSAKAIASGAMPPTGPLPEDVRKSYEVEAANAKAALRALLED